MATVHSVMMSYSYIIMIVGILFSVSPDGVNSQSAFSRCRILYDKQTCYSYYTQLRDNLLEDDPANIYELQQAFYPMGRFTSNILLNVLYKVHFQKGIFSSNSPFCNPVKPNQSRLNSNTSDFYFLLGWSSSEIFNILSPLQLSELQLQISNAIYGLFLVPGSGVTLADSFGWPLKDAEDEPVRLTEVNLIRLELNLTNNTICVPDEELLISVLQDITIMLKVWASTQGETPEEINEKNLGFVTQAGIQYYADESKEIHIIFRPFFAALIALVSCIFGLISIVILGSMFPKAYAYLSDDRRQFKYYFFALAVSLFLMNILIVVMDMVKLKDTCKIAHYSYITNLEEVGCSGVVITKVIYFVLCAILSLIAAILSSKHSKLLRFQHIKDDRLLRLIHVLCSWSIIFFLSLVVWAITPTTLMMIIYPHIVLPITVVMLASIFWLSVMLTIPQIFFYNIRKNMKCLDTLFYIMPFAGLIVLVFLIGIITVIYVNSVVFGSDIGGPIGLLLATIPSIALTFFSEFYRDWFLTTTTGPANGMDRQSGQFNSEMIEMQGLGSKTASLSVGDRDSTSIFINNITTDDRTESEAEKQIREPSNKPLGPNKGGRKKTTWMGRRRAIRRPTRLISTGEPPGFLHRRLNYITRPRVYSTPNSAADRKRQNHHSDLTTIHDV